MNHIILDGRCLLVTPPVLTGKYERGVTAFLRAATRPGDIAVEIGANQGFHTLTLAALVRPHGGHVYAFEPHPRTRRFLEDNITTNGLSDTVTVIEAAMWSHNGDVLFRARTREAAGSYLRDALTILGDRAEGEDITVPAVAAGSWFADLPSPPKIIKIDAEGAERTVIESAAETLRTHHPTIVVELLPSSFRSLEEVDRWEAWLRDLGYNIGYLNHLGRLVDLDCWQLRLVQYGAEVVLWVPGGRGAPT